MASGSSNTSTAADCLNTPAPASSNPDQSHCRRSINSKDAVSGSIMKASVLAAKSRGLPAAVITP